METSGKPKSGEREAQLARALRANLRRRKAADRVPAAAPPTGEGDKSTTRLP